MKDVQYVKNFNLDDVKNFNLDDVKNFNFFHFSIFCVDVIEFKSQNVQTNVNKGIVLYGTVVSCHEGYAAVMSGDPRFGKAMIYYE